MIFLLRMCVRVTGMWRAGWGGKDNDLALVTVISRSYEEGRVVAKASVMNQVYSKQVPCWESWVDAPLKSASMTLQSNPVQSSPTLVRLLRLYIAHEKNKCIEAIVQEKGVETQCLVRRPRTKGWWKKGWPWRRPMAGRKTPCCAVRKNGERGQRHGVVN